MKLFFASNTFKSLGGIFKTIIGPAGIFGLMLVFFKALQNPWFRDAVSSLITFVKGVFTNTFDFLSDAFNAIVDLVGGVTDKLGTIFGGDATFKERTDALVGIFGDLGKFIFNIGNSQPTELLQFIELLENALGQKAIMDFQPMQPGDVYKTWADITKAKRLLNYEPKTSINEGLLNFVEWYKSYYNL